MPIDFNNPDALKQSLFSNPNQQQASIDQLLRSVGSLNAQSLNLFRDSAGAQGLPLEARLAQERGLAIRGNQTAQQGIFDITQFFQNKDSDAARFLLNQMLQKDLQQSSQDNARGNSILNLIGSGAQALGNFFGSKNGKKG